MKYSTPLLVYGCAALALLAWAGVFFEAHSIAAGREAHVAALEQQAKNASDESAQLRAASLVKETEGERAKLATLVSTDIVSASNLITQAGRRAGVNLRLSGALPEQPLGAEASLGAVGFDMQADGTFPTLMRAIAALEALPIPSSVVRVEMRRTDAEKGVSNLWHINAHVVILTTAAAL